MSQIKPVLFCLLLAQPAFAEGAASGDAIRSAIAGNTVAGSMSASGAYTEFYGADGSIRAKDYSGTWSIEGDQMCFSYGTDPATCFGVEISGNSVTWLGESGPEGTGTVAPGNPGGL